MTDTLTDFRVTMIEEQGFSHEDAAALAKTFYDVTVTNDKGQKVTYKMRTDNHQIAKMLKNGATHDQIKAILL